MVRKGIGPQVVVTQRLLTGVLTVVGPPDCRVLVVTVIDGCDEVVVVMSGLLDCRVLVAMVINGCGEVVVVMSGSNDIMDSTGLPGLLLASLIASILIFKDNDVRLRVAYCHTSNDANFMTWTLGNTNMKTLTVARQ